MTELRIRLNEEQNRKVELLKPIFRCRSKEALVLKLLDLVNITEPSTENIMGGFRDE